MRDTVRINLHCHSSFSDGQLSPEQLAERLRQDGVRFAALTDHHTLAGLARFEEAAEREGIGVITGVEVFAESGQGLVHLLAYGFDPDSAELGSALGIASRAEPASAELAVSPPRKLSVDDVCRVVHQAGGRVFLAHPLDREREPARLDELVRSLQAAGLDGLEAVYAPYDGEQTRALIELARRHDLLVSGGSDFHGPDAPRLAELGVDMPRKLWVRFRNQLFAAGAGRSVAPRSAARSPQRPSTRLNWTGFFARILLPTLVAIGLLVVPLFTIIIPAFEDALLSRKREMIRELTNSAASMLAEYHADEQSGRLSRAEAQRAAAERVQFLRYGKEGKDYFWITDQHPRMVMHPYRTDLNGQDVSGFRDPKGNPVFMEFLRVVREQQEGYVEYVWQWKDDPARLAPKQSYVKGFEPWGWVIGTGIYIEDVRAETAAISGRIIRLTVVLAVIIAVLLLFVAQQSLRLERRRTLAEVALRESHEKYRALVEASTEGMMLVVGGRLSYANQTLLSLLGYAECEIPLLEVDDVILEGPELPDVSGWLASATQAGVAPKPKEARLLKRSGDAIEVRLTVEPVALAGKSGWIIMARDLSSHKGLLAALDESQSALWRMATELGTRPGAPSSHDQSLAELEAVLRLLDQPVASLARPLPSCELSTRIEQAAALMNHGQSGALLVTGPEGAALGLVTDSDLRARVVGQGVSSTRPVHEIMSAPLIHLAPQVPGCLALMRMQEHHVQHVVVRGVDGQIHGVVGLRELLVVELFPLATLCRGIVSAGPLEDVLAWRARLPRLVRAMLSAGAKPRYVAGAITAVSDAITERLLRLAFDELGPPPAPYAFLALGSQGRGEQTLASDQDNALVFEVPEGAAPEVIHEYFVAVGERVCGWLARAGYALCKGGAMANNPRFCVPLERWKELFSGWINVAEPRDLLEFNVFFDFRFIHGSAELVGALRNHVTAELARTPSFFVHLAQNALHHKPLLSFFGNIVAERDDRGSARSLSIKEALTPIVSFARLYCLRATIPETNTFDRIRRLGQAGLLSPSLHEEVALAYELLMSLRLRHQSEAAMAGLPPGNQIEIGALTRIEQTLLKEVLAQVTALQKRVSADFLGGAWTQAG